MCIGRFSFVLFVVCVLPLLSNAKCIQTARYWWLTPVILATQKAEMWKIISRDAILKILNTEKGWCSGSSGRMPA
jgi:hypothetical protein